MANCQYYEQPTFHIVITAYIHVNFHQKLTHICMHHDSIIFFVKNIYLQSCQWESSSLIASSRNFGFTMSLMQIQILPFSSITIHSFFNQRSHHHESLCNSMSHVHRNTCSPHHHGVQTDSAPKFWSKTVKEYYQDICKLSTNPSFKAVNKLGLVVHTAVMLDPITECTIFHPKLGNCPFCFSIDQLYAHCKYDMCEVPEYDGSITGNSHAYHIPWQMQHDCIVNPCLLACAFRHLPQPYEWNEDEATGLDFTLQWSGPEPQHMLHWVLDLNDIQKQLMEHLAQWHEGVQNSMPFIQCHRTTPSTHSGWRLVTSSPTLPPAPCRNWPQGWVQSHAICL